LSVQVSTLANGLNVVTDCMEVVETVSMGAWISVGTRHELPHLNGISHLLEHMAFKGTERRSALEIAEEIEAVGGHLNAYTARENTAYFARVLKEDVALAVDVIADIVQNATLEADELERERAVIIQEINQSHDMPDDLIFDKFQETAFPDQAMGRPVLGSAELVQAMERETILDFMKSRYCASAMVAAAAGNVTHERFVDLAESAFGQLDEGGHSAGDAASYRGGDFLGKKDLEQVHLVLGFEGIGFEDDDYYPLALLSTLLGGGMSSRLFQEVREKRGLAYSIYSFGANYADGGLFGIYAGTGRDDVGKLVPVVCDELNKMRRGPEPSELARARAQLKASTLMSLESTSTRCEQAARQLQIYGRPIPISEIVARIEAVDAVAVGRIAERIVQSPPTLAALGPTDKLEPIERIAERFSA
jgi:predicted Zn-dependent peptidase